jgi:hypothetical protein
MSTSRKRSSGGERLLLHLWQLIQLTLAAMTLQSRISLEGNDEIGPKNQQSREVLGLFGLRANNNDQL